MKTLLVRIAILLASLACSAGAYATPIDLNDFYADPTVTVAADGSSAVMAEDSFFSLVILSNDPFLGDPNVIIPGVGVGLFFDYVFTEGAVDDDEFGVFVIDVATGLSAGAAFEFYADASASGTQMFDLTSLVGETLGLQFELNAYDFSLQSEVEISNVRLEMIAVPEPSILLLMVMGLIGVRVTVLSGRSKYV